MKITVDHISKQYGSCKALRDLTFSFERGEIVGIVGANGAGKSTTLGILTSYITPSAGRVLYDGNPLEGQEQKVLRSIGYLSEKIPLYPELQVIQQLSYYGGLRGLSSISLSDEIDRVMHIFDLFSQKNRLVSHLSKGFTQRLGFAQALLGDPQCLILDEPMSGLDPKQIVHMRSIIKELGKHKAIVVSSHDLMQVQQLCTTICILHKGVLVVKGSPKELEESTGHVFTVELTLLHNTEVYEQLQKALPQAQILFTDDGYIDGQPYSSFVLRSHTDIRKEINLFCYDQKIPIFNLSLVQKSLEELFMDITEEVRV